MVFIGNRFIIGICYCKYIAPGIVFILCYHITASIIDWSNVTSPIMRIVICYCVGWRICLVAYCIQLTVCIVTIVKYFFSPCFVYKLTAGVFVCVFNSVSGFALSSIIIHSFKMFSILYIASLKFIFAKKKNNRLTSKKNVKGNIKISGIKLEFSNEEEYIIAQKTFQ